MHAFRNSVILTFIGLLAAIPSQNRMAPLSSYLMKRPAEINLARSAAPSAISGHATIMVLTRHGYEVAQSGGNGFTCIVERGWMVPFGRTTFWSTKMLAPTCYNAAASRTVLIYTLKRTKLALAGASTSQIESRIVAGVRAKTLPTPEPGSMAYMMSKSQYLNSADKAWFPHVMIFAPMADGANNGANWGADLSRSPIVFDPEKMPEPWACFFIPVSHWSDGSPAPPYSGT